MTEKSELEQELSDKSSLLRLWIDLTESPAWVTLEAVMTEQKNARAAIICGVPLKTLDEVPEQEFKKGEVAGIGLMLAYPKTAIEVLEAEIEALNSEAEVASESQTDRKPDVPSRVDDVHFHSSDGDIRTGD